jgi:alkanesulfonate monooxygenase SsuD/methylene tetrahydromethanopterin reductase-like flavin-dependent oxidoreductase (luciferase family)
MAGRKAIETHVAPKIRAAAKEAGRSEPRVVVALPVAVSDDEPGARERAARTFAVYGNLVNYRRILDVEGGGPGDVAVVGSEASVERQIRAFAAAGATEFVASIFPAGDDTKASIKRTRMFVNGLVGKV